MDPSPWPILASCTVLSTALGLLFWMHLKLTVMFFFSVVMLLFISMSWWKDVVRESSYLGFHGVMVQKSLRIGMMLFIVSEVLFFFGFFWAFFHSGLTPLVDISPEWPLAGLEPLNPMAVPLLNTIVLLSSSVSITFSHYEVLCSGSSGGVLGLFITLLLSMFFTLLQVMEYMESGFGISDSVYSSVFFMATGFHGFHVIVGSIFLVVCFFRMLESQMAKYQHVGFECSIWYWHFVDVVWIFLYVSIYWWSSV